MDPRRFSMMYGGEFGRMEGLVYDCWSDEENICEGFELPAGTKYYAGVDWGYTDPVVIKVRAVTPDGRHYGISEFYKSRMTISDIIVVAKQKKKVFGIERFYCDPSQPGNIEEFNRAGLTAVGAPNDIRRGIDLHYELIKTRRYKEFRGTCPHSIDEREQYHYPEPKDLQPDQDNKEQLPVDQANHCMDVDRYLSMATYRHSKIRPISPTGEKKYSTMLEKLQKSGSYNKQTERFG